ncbi:hypothetical protein RNJ44_00903 [Nakaseomyces bracarensis]|uniref:Uncharacterized protein n=1 Tax=Nakaseomyces bracarensis TaxID=273131 RepID=A0ABR4NQC9_9SACH
MYIRSNILTQSFYFILFYFTSYYCDCYFLLFILVILLKILPSLIVKLWKTVGTLKLSQ